MRSSHWTWTIGRDGALYIAEQRKGRIWRVVPER
jgi:glucose/arabinose dehydrogenase